MIESSNDISADCLFMGSCYRKTTLESLGQTLSVVRHTFYGTVPTRSLPALALLNSLA